MAKDKDKLDITFQRAVFIVCNLKKLIKRPKKDSEKYTGLAAAAAVAAGATGSRKRHSGTNFDDDGSSSSQLDGLQGDSFTSMASQLAGPGGGGVGTLLLMHQPQGSPNAGGRGGALGGGFRRRFGSSVRVRDPIRRAFTLPTMLCSSFALGPNNHELANNTQTNPGGPWVNEGPDDEHDSAFDQLRGALGRAQEQLQQQQDASIPTAKAPARKIPANNQQQQPPPLPSGSYISFTPASPVRGGQLQLGGEHQRTSLSCLVTPIKIRGSRGSSLVLAAANEPRSLRSGSECSQRTDEMTAQQQHQQRQRHQDKQTTQPSSNHYGDFSNSLSTLLTTTGPNNTASASPRTQQQATVASQLWCPFWALAMELLDLQQGPLTAASAGASSTSGQSFPLQSNADLAAPSPYPFLLAPANQAANRHGKSIKSRNETGSKRNHVSAHERAVTGQDDDQEEGDLDSDDEDDGDDDNDNDENHDDDDDVEGDDDDDDDYDSNDDDDYSREDNNKHSDTDDLNYQQRQRRQKHTKLNKRRANYNKNNTDSNRIGLELDSASVSRMRMKRFSSALCLNDKVQDQRGPIKSGPKSGKQSEGDERSGDKKSCSSSTSTSASFNTNNSNKQNQGNSNNRKEKQQNDHEPKKGAKKAAPGPVASTQQRKDSKESKASSKSSSTQVVQRDSSAKGQARRAGPVGDLLAPPADDPVVEWARQRRPSVTNQGSVNVDQQALLSAVECNQLERARTILEDGKTNVNSLNGDKLTCLDIAVLMGNVEMVKLLQAYNAKESSAFLSSDSRANQLYSLYLEARRLVEDLSRSLQAINQQQQVPASPSLTNDVHTIDAQSQSSGATSSWWSAPTDSTLSNNNNKDFSEQAQQKQQQQLMLATGSLLSSALLEEKLRQLQYWKRRLELFMHMRYEFEQLEIPNAPELVVLQVVGETALGVKIVHSLQRCSSEVAPLMERENDNTTNSNQRQDSSFHSKHFNALDQMANLAKERRLRCMMGPKCSHWWLGEDLLLSDSLGAALACNPHHLYQPLARDFAGRLSDAPTWKRASNSSRQQQQKLAVFDQFVAQQLRLLSQQQVVCPAAVAAASNLQQQQHQQPQLHQQHQNKEQLNGPRLPRLQHLMYAHHQNESTDSACDQIAAANSRNSSWLEANHPGGSLAYQLMTAPQPKPVCRPLKHIAPLQKKQQVSTAPVVPAIAALVPAVPAEQAGAILSGNNNSHHQQPLVSFAAVNNRRRAMMQFRREVIITKYKIEWSTEENFEPVLSALIVYNTNSYPIECQIGGLENGCKYFVRVSSGNHKGFSEPRQATPVCLAPSSWHQCMSNKRHSRFNEKVYRKFTQLILLNRHLLEENQLNIFQRSLQVASGHKYHHFFMGSQTSSSKSSLINMLLLEASKQEKSSKCNKAYHSKNDCSLEGGQENKQQQQQQQQQHQASTAPSLKVKKNFKNFFQSNSTKFHKLNNQNKRGLYLASVIYHSPSRATQIQREQQEAAGHKTNQTRSGDKSSSAANQATTTTTTTNKSSSKTTGSTTNSTISNEDKILVTNDDRLPVIEILNDVVSPSSIMGEFYWLLKIAGARWTGIKQLRQQLSKSHSSSSLHLRLKFLSAIEQMQVALNLEDIGQVFYKLIQAHDGSIVICTCRHVQNTKQVSNLSIKWTLHQKIIPRQLRRMSEQIERMEREREREQLEQREAAEERRQQLERLEAKRCSAVSCCCSDTGYDLFEQQQHLIDLQSQPELDGLLAVQQQQQQNNNNETTGSIPSPSISVDSDRALCAFCQQRAKGQRNSNSEKPPNESELDKITDSAAGNTGAIGCQCKAPQSGVNSRLASQLQINNRALQRTSGQPVRSSSMAVVGGSSAMMHPQAEKHGGSFSLAPTTSTPATGPTGPLATAGLMLSSSGSLSVHTASSSPRPSGQAQLLQCPPQISSTYLMLASLGIYDLLLLTLKDIIEYSQNSTVPLGRGLYLAFLQLQTTVESMRLVVPRARPNMIPCTRIRDNSHVTREEWQMLKRFITMPRPKRGPLGSNEQAKRLASQQLYQKQLQQRQEQELQLQQQQQQQQQHQHQQQRQRATKLFKSKQQSMGRASDPAIWAPPSRSRSGSGSSGEQSRSPKDPNSNQNNHNKSMSGSLSVCGDADITQSRDRAKSVSPFEESSEQSRRNAQQAAQKHHQERQQQLKQHQQQLDSGLQLLSPQQQIDQTNSQQQQEQEQEQQQQHQYARSDTDLSGKNNRAGSEKGAAGGFSDPNLSLGQARLIESARSSGSGSRASPLPPIRQQSSVSSYCLDVATQSPEETFVRLIGSAAKRLLNELKQQLPLAYDEEENDLVSVLGALNHKTSNRIYHLEPIELSPQVTFILMMPAAEHVCPVTSSDRANILADSRDYMLLPCQMFETIHVSTYEPELFGKYSRLSAVLETDLLVAQLEYRQAFSTNELAVGKTRVDRLADMVTVAEEFWKQLRWLADVIAFARDKAQLSYIHGILRLGTIWRHFEPMTTSDSTDDLRALAAQQAKQFFSEHQQGLQQKYDDGQSVVYVTTAAAAAEAAPATTTTTSSGSEAVPMAAVMNDNESRSVPAECLGVGGSEENERPRLFMDKKRLVPEIRVPDQDSAEEGLGRCEMQERQQQQIECEIDVDFGGPKRQRRRAPRARHIRKTNKSGRSGAGTSSMVSRKRPELEPQSSRDSGRPEEEEEEEDADEECREAGAEKEDEEEVDEEEEEEGYEEEEAIYAYHISLRDATRAAAQRKNSQQSVNVFVDSGVMAIQQHQPNQHQQQQQQQQLQLQCQPNQLAESSNPNPMADSLCTTSLPLRTIPLSVSGVFLAQQQQDSSLARATETDIESDGSEVALHGGVGSGGELADSGVGVQVMRKNNANANANDSSQASCRAYSEDELLLMAPLGAERARRLLNSPFSDDDDNDDCVAGGRSSKNEQQQQGDNEKDYIADHLNEADTSLGDCSKSSNNNNNHCSKKCSVLGRGVTGELRGSPIGGACERLQVTSDANAAAAATNSKRRSLNPFLTDSFEL